MFDLICASAECWDATGSMMQGWAGFGGVIAVLYAAHKAADTFAAYRRQKQEDRRIDAAERILTLAYTLKRNIAAARSPMSSGSENHAATQQLQELDWYKGLDRNQQHKAQIGQVALRRLQQYQSSWDQIFATMPVARAFFGEHIEAYLQSIWQQVVAINVSAEMYRDDQGRDLDFTHKLERDFWGHGGPDDLISQKIDQAVAGLEAELLDVIRAKDDKTRRHWLWPKRSMDPAEVKSP